jgi:hypothetical protein
MSRRRNQAKDDFSTEALELAFSASDPLATEPVAAKHPLGMI